MLLIVFRENFMKFKAKRATCLYYSLYLSCEAVFYSMLHTKDLVHKNWTQNMAHALTVIQESESIIIMTRLIY